MSKKKRYRGEREERTKFFKILEYGYSKFYKPGYVISSSDVQKVMALVTIMGASTKEVKFSLPKGKRKDGTKKYVAYFQAANCAMPRIREIIQYLEK